MPPIPPVRFVAAEVRRRTILAKIPSLHRRGQSRFRARFCFLVITKISAIAAIIHKILSASGPGTDMVLSDVSPCAAWVIPTVKTNKTLLRFSFPLLFITTSMTRERRRLAYPICCQHRTCRIVTTRETPKNFFQHCIGTKHPIPRPVLFRAPLLLRSPRGKPCVRLPICILQFAFFNFQSAPADLRFMVPNAGPSRHQALNPSSSSSTLGSTSAIPRVG
jgi:hypothetical protein